MKFRRLTWFQAGHNFSTRYYQCQEEFPYPPLRLDRIPSQDGYIFTTLFENRMFFKTEEAFEAYLVMLGHEILD